MYFYAFEPASEKKNQKYIQINHGKKTVGNGYRSLLNM